MNDLSRTTLDRYLTLSRNPLPHRSDDVIAAEFATLCTLPHVQAVSFYSQHTLMVGTSMISITHPESGETHDIGEFIIYQHRERVRKMWDVMFAFQNITRKIDGCFHPHINTQTIAGFGDMGQLCIERGQFHIYQHLRSGEFHISTKLLLDILHTYDARAPFRKLEHWPVRTDE